jgi:hypothetical protein
MTYGERPLEAIVGRWAHAPLNPQQSKASCTPELPSASPTAAPPAHDAPAPRSPKTVISTALTAGPPAPPQSRRAWRPRQLQGTDTPKTKKA